MSQRDLATTMRRSESWVSQVERGVLPVDRLPVLEALAQALNVTAADLRPDALPERSDATELANDLDSLRLALSGHPALASVFGTETPAGVPADLDALAQEVEDAWTLTHESRLAELSDALLSLLPRLEVGARGGESDSAQALHRLRARAYQAAAAAFASQNEADAAWVAADRAIAAAELSQSPLDVVAGHFRLAHAFIRLHRYDQADHVTTTGIAALEPTIAGEHPPPEALALAGALHLVGAVISAQDGNRSAARDHLAAADRLAQELGEGRNDFGTEFGPTNVQLHRVAVAVDLGDAGEALDVADEIDPSGLSPERQAHLLIDIARAHAQRRHIADATATLLEAERLAPEQIRAHASVSETVADLLGQAGRRPSTELAELARRIDAA
jgi:transcriptional regulator with XRE-family HTH domain